MVDWRTLPGPELRRVAIEAGSIRPRESHPDPRRTHVMSVAGRRGTRLMVARLAPRENVLRLDDAGRGAAWRHMRRPGNDQTLWVGP